MLSIPRNPTGEIAAVWDWPWQWRYAVALTFAILSLAAGYWLIARPAPQEGLALLVSGAGLFFALTIAYELFGLLMLLAVVGAIWFGIDLVIPESWSNYELAPKTRDALLLVGVFMAVYVGYEAITTLTKLREELAQARAETRQLAEVTHGLIHRNQYLLDLLRQRSDANA